MMPPLDLEIKIHEDNEGGIKMANNRFSSRCTRYFEVKRHIIQDTVEEGIVRVEYVQSGDQNAYVLAKPLDAKSKFLLNVRWPVMRGISTKPASRVAPDHHAKE